MRRVCVFCGAAAGHGNGYRDAATSLGRALASRGLGLVYGAGRTGLMGALATAALDAGAEVIGVVPDALNTAELVHASLTRLHVVEDLGTRKRLMAELSDAFIALPGGLGTLDELLEVAAARQLGFHRKPVGLLDVEGYFDPLLAQLDHAVREGFLAAAERTHLAVAKTPAELLDRMTAADAPDGGRGSQGG